MTKEGKISAWELMQQLQADPEWVARDEADKREREKYADEYRRDVAPVVEDLAEIGFDVESPSYLKLRSDPYPEAFPVLLRHLQQDHPHRIRESIVAALGVPYAAGEPARAILEQFRHSGNEHRMVRFRMADTLEIIADRSMVEELEQLAAKERDKGIAGMLAKAAKSAKRRKIAT